MIANGACSLPDSWRLTVCDYVEGALTLEQTRLDLLRHSRGHFIEQAARIDVHHGTLDQTVDVIQSRLLAEHAAAASPPLATFHYFEYPTGGHSLASLPGHHARVRAFLCAAYDLPPRRPGDIDEDGDVDGADLGHLLNAWGLVTATSRADMDADHAVGAADLAALLGAWGS